MQKWEYCAVVGMRTDSQKLDPYYPAIWYFTSEGFKVVSLLQPGTEKGGPPYQLKKEANEVSKAIARLGQDGWEMVGCGTTGRLLTPYTSSARNRSLHMNPGLVACA